MDLPSLPGHAQDHGVSWRCYTASNDYPAGFYTQLNGSPNLVPSSRFLTDAQAGNLPQLCYLWHDFPEDEHPPADVTVGMRAVQQAVDAVVTGGGWEETVFLLTWDDWGGWDDHVATPNVEQTADGVQIAYGPRVPLLMFGGAVPPVVDSRWCSHVSVPKTALQLLGLPALGVPRVDDDPGLADLGPRHGQHPSAPGTRHPDRTARAPDAAAHAEPGPALPRHAPAHPRGRAARRRQPARAQRRHPQELTGDRATAVPSEGLRTPPLRPC